MVHMEVDLATQAFGIPWGHTRSYANVLTGEGNGTAINGNRWYVKQLKELSFPLGLGTTQPVRVVVVDGANSSQYFTLDDGVYVNEYAGWNLLYWNSSDEEYLLTQAGSGQQWVFYDHTVSPELRGQLKRVVDPAGQTVTLDYDMDGHLEKFEQQNEGQTSGFYYTWTDLFSIESVSLKLDDFYVRRVRFSYYEDGDAGGSGDDLKSAVIEDYDRGTASWRIVERKHYRYYLTGEVHGFASGLKFVIGAGAYQMMLDAGLNPETATESELESFADFYYEYDSEKRVSLERVEGGRRQYSFVYTVNASPVAGPNNWLTKTVETLPDGSEHRVYTDDGYNMLVKILQKAGSSDQWVDSWRYTLDYRLEQHAWPSAVASVTEPSGGGGTLTVNLRAAAGKIEVTQYYASSVGDGAVEGYVSARGVKEGSGGTLLVAERLKYATQVVGGQSVHTVKERKVYPVAGMPDEDAPTTTYVRTYYTDGAADTFQVYKLTTTYPAVSTDENGTGEEGVTEEVYDRFGRTTWQKNQRGVITYMAYVQVTGALLQQIDDVNTALAPEPPPSGWSATGDHLVTDYLSDARGRQVQSRGPWHEVELREADTTVTAIRRVQFTAYDDEAHEVRRASGYLTGNTPTQTFTIVGAVAVIRRDANGRVVDEIQAVRCCATGALTPGEPLPQEKWSRWTHNIYDPWGRLYARRVYHSIPAHGEGDEGTNYLETLFGYDTIGRQNRVVDAAKTIQRTVYNVRDLVVSQWMGTDDAGATDFDPTGGGMLGNNMVAIELLQYDGGTAGADGNLTDQTLPVDDTSGNDRITTYSYDFRNRRETTTNTDGITVWITKETYDNLDRTTGSIRYHTAVDDNHRITQDRSYYDAIGRVYKIETDGIDPSTGDVAGTMIGRNWYDLAGNLIKQSKPGNTAFTKTVYDSMARPVITYLACVPGSAGVPSGDNNDVSDDTVIEQSETSYDRAGNIIMQTQKKRFDDATGMGALGGPHASGDVPKSRDTYGMVWPDALGRPRVSADYGTNGGSVPARPTVAPARSDTTLVTTNRYKDSGDANAIVDPMGIETRWENDQAGRRIRLIEGLAPPYVVQSLAGSLACVNPPYPPHSVPRITEFGWHPSGQLAKLTLMNAETGDQTTRWLFGTTLADSAVASNSLVRTKIYPESDDRPAPASDGPDGIYSRLEYRYNRQGQQTSFKDADGTTHEYSYDKVGNLTDDRVTVLAAGLNGEVRRIAHAFDKRGLKAKVTSYDAATGGSVVNEVAFEYDAFLQISADRQSHSGAVDGSTPKVTYAYESGAKNSVRRTATTYPTNTRIIEVHYGASNSIDDHLSRVSALKLSGETDDLVDYTYCGQAWQVRVGYPTPGLELKYRRLTNEPVGDAGDPYSGYDRFGRTVDMPWVKTSDDSVVERSQYGFDRNSCRTWQKRPLTDTLDQHYSYDALSQVSIAACGSLNLNTTAISGIPTRLERWDYDPTGNWRTYRATANGTSTLDQHRVHDRGNRLTQIAGDPHNMVLDRVGRIRQMSPDAERNWEGTLQFTWDAWSRITSVKSNGEVVGTYAYDGRDRRITRETSEGTIHSYYSSSWRPVEERKDTESTAVASYLWGARHRDDLVRRDRAADGISLNETRYVLMNYFDPASITDEGGLVKERYAFSAFGLRTILDSNYITHATSECAFEFSFQGQFVDVESGLINYGYRYYTPSLGRWLCKDPAGEDGGLNLYAMSGNSTINKVDYLGLISKETRSVTFSNHAQVDYEVETEDCKGGGGVNAGQVTIAKKPYADQIDIGDVLGNLAIGSSGGNRVGLVESTFEPIRDMIESLEEECGGAGFTHKMKIRKYKIGYRRIDSWFILSLRLGGFGIGAPSTKGQLPGRINEVGWRTEIVVLKGPCCCDDELLK